MDCITLGFFVAWSDECHTSKSYILTTYFLSTFLSIVYKCLSYIFLKRIRFKIKICDYVKCKSSVSYKISYESLYSIIYDNVPREITSKRFSIYSLTIFIVQIHGKNYIYSYMLYQYFYVHYVYIRLYRFH